MSYEVNVEVCPEILTNNIKQCERHAEFSSVKPGGNYGTAKL